MCASFILAMPPAWLRVNLHSDGGDFDPADEDRRGADGRSCWSRGRIDQDMPEMRGCRKMVLLERECLLSSEVNIPPARTSRSNASLVPDSGKLPSAVIRQL